MSMMSKWQLLNLECEPSYEVPQRELMHLCCFQEHTVRGNGDSLHFLLMHSNLYDFVGCGDCFSFFR